MLFLFFFAFVSACRLGFRFISFFVIRSFVHCSFYEAVGELIIALSTACRMHGFELAVFVFLSPFSSLQMVAGGRIARRIFV